MKTLKKTTTRKRELFRALSTKKKFIFQSEAETEIPVEGLGIDEVRTIAETFGIEDIQLVKPGIGETTRVLLRRLPSKILIDSQHTDNTELAHIIRLAEEKNVPVETYPLHHYKCVGIIQKIADV